MNNIEQHQHYPLNLCAAFLYSVFLHYSEHDPERSLAVLINVSLFHGHHKEGLRDHAINTSVVLTHMQPLKKIYRNQHFG